MFIPHFRAESLEGISLNLNGVNTQLVAPAKTHHMRKLERGEEGRKRGGVNVICFFIITTHKNIAFVTQARAK